MCISMLTILSSSLLNFDCIFESLHPRKVLTLSNGHFEHGLFGFELAELVFEGDKGVLTLVHLAD